MKTFFKHFIFASFIGLISFSCKQIEKIGDRLVIQTEREKYAQGFEKEDPLFIQWKNQFSLSYKDSLKVELPYFVQGTFVKERNEVLSYNVFVHEGQRLVIERLKVNDSAKVFVDVLIQSNSELGEKSKLFEGVLKSYRNIILDNGINKYVKVLIQPEINLQSQYAIKIYTEPIYAFPVSGYTNNSIGSFWGDSRDAGRRSHKGIDIFAKRGTPVIAITDGRVRKTGDYGLGGKQVWIRDSKMNNSLYYAHLDSISIRNGVRVNIGDTLGFVGNTGNARTTAPHLHFGIYKRFEGAIDPLPFVKATPLIDRTEKIVSSNGYLQNVPSNIRIGPSTKFEKLATINEPTTFDILGKTEEWYHIILPQGEKGFIHQSLVKESI